MIIVHMNANGKSATVSASLRMCLFTIVLSTFRLLQNSSACCLPGRQLLLERTYLTCKDPWAGAKQPVHWFLGGKGLGLQQGTSVWVDSSKSSGRSLTVVNSQGKGDGFEINTNSLILLGYKTSD